MSTGVRPCRRAPTKHDYEDDGQSTGRLSRRHSAVRLVDEEHKFHGLHDHTSIYGASLTVGRERQIVSILVRSFSLQPQTFDLIAILRSSRNYDSFFGHRLNISRCVRL